MIMVLFEVTIKKTCMKEYLALAATLKDELAQAEGFIRSERFSSLVNEGKLLSLSVWENEQAIDTWRNTVSHRLSQRQGREAMFESYTITVASSLRRYTDTERQETPADSQEFFSEKD